MAIRLQNGPEDGFSILQQRLPDAYRHHQDRKGAGGAPAEEINLSKPHRVFTVDLPKLVKGDALEHAHTVSWRYMLMHGTDTVASAELTSEGGGGSAEYAGYFQGSFDGATAEAVNRFEGKLDENLDYELRLLRIPEVYVIALWLHATKAPTRDEFMPLEGTPPELEQFATYDRKKMNDALKALGEAKLKDIAAEEDKLEDGMEDDEEITPETI